MSLAFIIAIGLVLGGLIVLHQYVTRPMSEEEYEEALSKYHWLQTVWPVVKYHVYAFIGIIITIILAAVLAALRLMK